MAATAPTDADVAEARRSMGMPLAGADMADDSVDAIVPALAKLCACNSALAYVEPYPEPPRCTDGDCAGGCGFFATPGSRFCSTCTAPAEAAAAVADVVASPDAPDAAPPRPASELGDDFAAVPFCVARFRATGKLVLLGHVYKWRQLNVGVHERADTWVMRGGRNKRGLEVVAPVKPAGVDCTNGMTEEAMVQGVVRAYAAHLGVAEPEEWRTRFTAAVDAEWRALTTALTARPIPQL